MPSPWLDAYTWEGLQPLIDTVQAQEAKLVIIDNLLAVKGRADETSAEMGGVMAHFRRFTEKMGVATILIHHQRKEIAANSRAGDRVRGHSSIEAALDLALLVERAYQSDLLIIRSTKERGVTVPPFGALFTYEHQTGTVELGTARFFGVEVEDSVSDRAIEQAVLGVGKETCSCSAQHERFSLPSPGPALGDGPVISGRVGHGPGMEKLGISRQRQ
jgi:predicted ATP-dependent serine protease